MSKLPIPIRQVSRFELRTNTRIPAFGQQFCPSAFTSLVLIRLVTRLSRIQALFSATVTCLLASFRTAKTLYLVVPTVIPIMNLEQKWRFSNSTKGQPIAWHHKCNPTKSPALRTGKGRNKRAVATKQSKSMSAVWRPRGLPNSLTKKLSTYALRVLSTKHVRLLRHLAVG